MISRRLNSVRRLFSIVPDFRSLYPDTREDFEYLRLNSKEKSKGVERRYTKNEIGFFFSKTRLKQTSTFKKKKVYGKYHPNQVPLDAIQERTSNKLIIDEETGLMYGFQFDDYIEMVKKQGEKGVADFTEDIELIFQQLGFRQKDDLVFLHRYIIAQATKGNYLKQAKALLLDAIIAEVLNLKQAGMRNRSKVVDMLGEEQWSSVKNVIDTSDMDSAVNKVKELALPEDAVDSIALYLAKEKVKNSLISKSKTNLKGFIQNKMDLTEALIHQDDPYYGDNDERIVLSTSEILRHFSSTNLKEFKSELTPEEAVRSHLKRVYFQNKEKIIRESAIQNPGESRWTPTPLVKGKEEEKERKDRALEKKLIEMFEPDELDLKMARMEQRLKLTNKDALTYDDIMIRLDQILEKMPETLRNVFEPKDMVETVESLAPIEYSQQDLLWKNFSGHFYKILPRLTYTDQEGFTRSSFRYEDASVTARSEVFASVATHFKQTSYLNDREKTFEE